MIVRNKDSRSITLKDEDDVEYVVPGNGDLVISDALWNDTVFRRNLRLRGRDITIGDSYTLYQITETIDLASVNANTTSQVNLSITAGKVKSGDLVQFIGAAGLEHGILIQGSLPAPSDNTITLRVSNVTGGSINPASHVFYFLVSRAS